MSVYFITIMFVLVFSYAAEGGRRRYRKDGELLLSIVFLYLAIISSLRYRVGTDFRQYEELFGSYVSNIGTAIRTFNEPGIYIIAKIASTLNGNSQTMIAISAVITIACFVTAIKRDSENYLVSSLLFLFCGCWTGAFNGIRQYLAAAVLVCGYRFIIERRFLKYCIVVFISMVFHRSAFLLLPLFFVPMDTINTRNTVRLVIGGIFIYFASNLLIGNISLLLPKYDGVDLTQYAYVTQNVKWQRVLVSIVPLITAWLMYGRVYIIQDRKRVFFFNIALLNTVFSVATSTSAYLARIVVYTNAFLPIAYANIFRNKTGADKVVIMTMLILFCLYWLYEISITPALYLWQWCF